MRVEGPNGSGKTTLLKILSGQLSDYEGELFWGERPMRQARESFLTNLLYLGHAPGVKAALTPLENLAWYQALAGQPVDEQARLAALEEVGLAGFEDVPAGQLSAGSSAGWRWRGSPSPPVRCGCSMNPSLPSTVMASRRWNSDWSCMPVGEAACW